MIQSWLQGGSSSVHLLYVFTFALFLTCMPCHLVQESFGVFLAGGFSRLANLPSFVQNDVSIVSLVFGGSKRLCVFNIQKRQRIYL